MKKYFSAASLKAFFEIINKQHADPRGKSPLTRVINSQKELKKLSKKCLSGNYKFTPYTLKLVLKGRGKIPREVSVPSFLDKGILKALDQTIKSACPIDNQTDLAFFIIQNIKKFLSGGIQADTCVMRLDIKQYFDKIDHAILLQKLKKKKCPIWLQKITNNAIETPAKEKGFKTPSKKTVGVPQGLSIASYLADIYLDEFDKSITKYCLKAYRYVDDILIVYKKDQEDKILALVQEKLKLLDLEIHDETGGKFFKDTIFSKKGFDFLGYHFFVTTKNIRVSVREASVQKFINSLIAIITATKKGGYDQRYGSVQQADNFCQFDLNEKITGAYKDDKRYGWLWYFRQMNDLTLLDKIDRIIKTELAKNKRTRKIKVKRLKRTFYEIQNFGSGSSYILNYGLDDPTVIKSRYAGLDKNIQHANSKAQILAAFNNFTNRRLRRLMLDEIRAS